MWRINNTIHVANPDNVRPLIRSVFVYSQDRLDRKGHGAWPGAMASQAAVPEQGTVPGPSTVPWVDGAQWVEKNNGLPGAAVMPAGST